MPLLDAFLAKGKKNDFVPINYPAKERQDPVLASSFSVSFEGLGADTGGLGAGTVGFSSISGIGSQIKTDEVAVGSDPVIIAIPSGVSYSPVSFKRGVTTETMVMGLLKWFNGIKDLMTGFPNFESRQYAEYPERGGSSYAPKMKKRAVTIKMPQNPTAVPSSNADLTKIPMLYIILRDAWPSKFSLGELDAGARSVLIFELEMQYGGMEIRDNL